MSSAHLDFPDSAGERGAMACIVIPYITDIYKQDRTVCGRSCGNIDDHLSYHQMIFHPYRCDQPGLERHAAQNHSVLYQRVPGLAFPKPGEPDDSGDQYSRKTMSCPRLSKRWLKRYW